MKVKSESEVTQSCLTLSDPMDCSLLGSSVNGIFPDKSTGVGCHCLLHKYIRYFAKRWKNSVLNKKYEVPVLMELMVLCMWQILNQYSHNLKINIGKCDDWIWCIYRSALETSGGAIAQLQSLHDRTNPPNKGKKLLIFSRHPLCLHSTCHPWDRLPASFLCVLRHSVVSDSLWPHGQ